MLLTCSPDTYCAITITKRPSRESQSNPGPRGAGSTLPSEVRQRETGEDLCPTTTGRRISTPSACVSCSRTPRTSKAIDEIFEADLVRSQSFEVVGEKGNVIVLRDATGFDTLLTVTCSKITDDRTAEIEAARASHEAEEDE